jgi:MYXO-CTERM domain-containing protein
VCLPEREPGCDCRSAGHGRSHMGLGWLLMAFVVLLRKRVGAFRRS